MSSVRTSCANDKWEPAKPAPITTINIRTKRLILMELTSYPTFHPIFVVVLTEGADIIHRSELPVAFKNRRRNACINSRTAVFGHVAFELRVHHVVVECWLIKPAFDGPEVFALLEK